ncbi:MAG: Parallel beta-helix repeat protein, partial [Planctomycetaceae bacterium]|nr:Parallel beta-helix repeat protein [Planctomycetaceae bacterium]
GLAASADKLCGQNFFGSGTIYMPDGRPQRILSRQPVQERLYSNVERNYRVNIYRRTLHETLRAINPDTGLPYIVHHVDNAAASPGTGNGNVKNPFGSLADAAPGADIIFVHHNAVDANNNPITTGYDTGIVLSDNQRLLGQGTEHFFTDLNHGTFILPGNDGGPQPLITNTAGDVVTLANNNEVSGFQIGGPSPNNPVGNGIFGSGITDFNINHNTIQSADLAGISLVNASGTGSITMNNLANNTLENISIVNTGAPALTLDLSNNDSQTGLAGAVIRGDASDITATIDSNNFSNNTNTGLDISAANGGTTLASITNNVFNNNGGNGLQVNSDAGTMNLTIQDNTANSNVQSGFDFSTANGGLLTVDATDNAINSNTLDGLHVMADSGTIDFTEFSFNTLNTNGQQGITLDANNGGILSGTFASNSIQNNALGGLNSTLDNGSQSTLTIENNTINGNTGFGLSFSALNGSLINNTLNSNTVDNNVGPGVLLAASNSSHVTFAADSNDVSNNQGIGFDSAIANSTSNITLTNNIFNANQDAGVRLGYTGATTATQLIDGNTITNTTDIASTATPNGDGLIVNLDGTGGTPTLASTIQNNTIQNNVGTGILENLNANASNVTLNDIVNNNILGNGRDGISMQLNFGSVAVLNASNNIITTQTATRTGVDGININLQADSKLTANISDNTINGSSDGTNFSTGSGVMMNIEEDGILSATLTNNLIRQNGVDGVHVGPDPLSNGQLQGGFNAPQGTATIGVTLNQNTIELNRHDGVHVSVAQVTEGAPGMTGVGNYTVNGNVIRNNGTVVSGVRSGDGINAEVRSGIMNFIATNNTISNNASDGILLRNSMGAAVDGGVQVPNVLLLTDAPKAILNATVDGNTITGNGNRGVNIRYEDASVNAATQSLGAYGNVSLTNNTISGNKDEGVLVIMNNQRNDVLATGFASSIAVDQNNPIDDPTAVANRYPAFSTFPDYFINFANADVYSDLKFAAVGNTISNNGGGNPAGADGLVAGDGMLLLVGTSSYLHADVRNNQFSGNFLDDFRTDSFISQPNAPKFIQDSPVKGLTQIFLDHISLMDLRFTGNTGNSIGGVTSSSDSQRDVNGVLRNGRYQNDERDTVNKVLWIYKVPDRRTDYFRIEDTPSPAGSVLNGTNLFTSPDSTNPRNNFLDNGFIQVPIGSLFP